MPAQVIKLSGERQYILKNSRMEILREKPVIISGLEWVKIASRMEAAAGKTILIVEDEHDVVELLLLSLRKARNSLSPKVIRFTSSSFFNTRFILLKTPRIPAER